MLRIKEVSHAYGKLVSLRGVSLQVDLGEIVCLLGPSGCGKTTLLRIVAGLETNFQGQLTFNGVDIAGTPAHTREFGLMFQDFALFPHMSVAENVAYGLKRRGIGRPLICSQVQALLERVGLKGMGARNVASLSGGQKQRVALARSLAPNPRLLMLDEPLGSLDAQLRDQLALELRSLIKKQGLSAIYVTHDHREAYAVADRIAVMDYGSVEQVDTPRKLYQTPKSAFVAHFLGMSNAYPTNLSPFTKQLCVQALSEAQRSDMILIHPAGIWLGSSTAGDALQWQATLLSKVFRGNYYDVTVSVDEDTALSFAAPQAPAAIGDEVSIEISREAVIPLHN